MFFLPLGCIYKRLVIIFQTLLSIPFPEIQMYNYMFHCWDVQYAVFLNTPTE